MARDFHARLRGRQIDLRRADVFKRIHRPIRGAAAVQGKAAVFDERLQRIQIFAPHVQRRYAQNIYRSGDLLGLFIGEAVDHGDARRGDARGIGLRAVGEEAECGNTGALLNFPGQTVEVRADDHGHGAAHHGHHGGALHLPCAGDFVQQRLLVSEHRVHLAQPGAVDRLTGAVPARLVEAGVVARAARRVVDDDGAVQIEQRGARAGVVRGQRRQIHGKSLHIRSPPRSRR